ncbi:hypothetical protein [Ralstonia flaminis]|jgi:hypothetical protein|uniref:Uncharacterized protein n=1 Tax=Ralstonia flaminis TaxID=3058597 RepID=A0ABM9K382_9RALS|nr:hypothetical protein [Ralstonia sp. LMG 18101]CAJ0813222.1 hypothetical protein LMG18101_01832 [Ralstonia sp. LMG 18101]
MQFLVGSLFSVADPTGPANAAIPVTLQTINSIGPNSSEEAVLIRLLLGTLQITHVPSGKSWRQKINYSVSGAPGIMLRGKPGVTKLLQSADIDSTQLEQYLKKSLRHRPYHRDILLEAVHYFYRTRTGNHCNAFLHVYRLLERISFVFPLIYASSTDDYKGTYEMLRDFFNGESKGELAFFSKFLKTTVEPVLLDSDSTVNLSPLNNPQEGVKILKRFLKNIKSETNSHIEFANRDILPMLIGIRNKFFHFASGQGDNLTLVDVPDPDGFFSCVNQVLFNWIAIIYFVVLRKQIDRYV